MTPRFPRPQDDEPHAWGLDGDMPTHVSERLSPLYEAQAERLVRAVEARGWTASLGGAGSEDGEYLWADRAGHPSRLLGHLEDPSEAQFLAALDDAALGRWLDRELPAVIDPDRGQV